MRQRDHLLLPFALLTLVPVLCAGCAARVAKVELRRGDTLVGYVQNKTLSIRTDYATLTYPSDRIHEMDLEAGADRQHPHALELFTYTYPETYEQVAGELQDKSLKLRLTTGQDIELPIADIRRVTAN